MTGASGGILKIENTANIINGILIYIIPFGSLYLSFRNFILVGKN